MKQKYTRKHICEAIKYWKKQLKKLNESGALSSDLLLILDAAGGEGGPVIFKYSNLNEVSTKGFKDVKDDISLENSGLPYSHQTFAGEEIIKNLPKHFKELIRQYKANAAKGTPIAYVTLTPPIPDDRDNQDLYTYFLTIKAVNCPSNIDQHGYEDYDEEWAAEQDYWPWSMY